MIMIRINTGSEQTSSDAQPPEMVIISVLARYHESFSKLNDRSNFLFTNLNQTLPAILHSYRLNASKSFGQIGVHEKENQLITLG